MFNFADCEEYFTGHPEQDRYFACAAADRLAAFNAVGRVLGVLIDTAELVANDAGSLAWCEETLYRLLHPGTTTEREVPDRLLSEQLDGVGRRTYCRSAEAKDNDDALLCSPYARKLLAAFRRSQVKRLCRG